MGQEDYRKKLSDIGGTKLDGLTVAEAAELLREYARYEKLASQPRAAQPRAAQARPASGSAVPLTLPVSERKRRRRFDEMAVGKYLMTAAAAVLCILGAAVFAAGFWHGLPGAAKYGLLLFAGIGAWALGYKKSMGAMRPFWLGVAGFGSGVAFLDLVLGCVEWDLYGFIFTGVLCMAWTGACFLMAKRTSSWLFYAIAYAGGWTAFYLSWNTVSSFTDELACCLAAFAILAMGAAAWRFNKRHWILAAAWLVSCWAMGHWLARFRWPILDGFGWSHCYMYFCAAMACGSTWFLAKAVPDPFRDRTRGKLLMALLAFADAFFVRDMCASFFTYGNRALDVLAVGILLSGLAVAKPGYLLGIAVPVAGMAAGTGGWSGPLLVSCLALAACLASVRFREKTDRAGLALFWASAATAAIAGASAIKSGLDPDVATFAYWPGHPWAYGASAVILAAGLGFWAWLRHKNDDWSAGRLSWLAMLCGALYVLAIPVEAGWVPWYALLCIAALSVNGFRRLAVRGMDVKRDAAALAATVILSAVCVWSLTAECLFLGAFGTEILAAEPAVLTVTLFLMAAMDAYGMAVLEYPAQGALACLAANWCLWLSAGIWTPEARSAISVLGILLSAAFVAAGFRLDKKPARVAGLACALLYALKLGLYDASLSGGLGMAAGLLISGVGCFGISLLYNRLGKALQNSHDREDADDGR